MLARPGGLTLSDAAAPQQQKAARALTFDTKRWSLDRDADYTKRQFDLVRAAAEAPFTGRTASRLELARFYFARQMYPEAKAVLDTAIADERPTADDPAPLVLRAVANIMLGRVEAAQKDLANPRGRQSERRAAVARAGARPRRANGPDARDAFRSVEGALGALPLELQRAGAEGCAPRRDRGRRLRQCREPAQRLQDHRSVARRRARGVGADRPPRRSASAARRMRSRPIASPPASNDRPAAAQGRLREIALRYSLGETKKADFISELESLTTAWRGDETEVEALQTAGAALHRDGPLPRCVPRHARGADARFRPRR